MRRSSCPSLQASEQEMAVRAQLRADIESKLRFELRQEYKVRSKLFCAIELPRCMF